MTLDHLDYMPEAGCENPGKVIAELLAPSASSGPSATLRAAWAIRHVVGNLRRLAELPPEKLRYLADLHAKFEFAVASCSENEQPVDVVQFGLDASGGLLLQLGKPLVARESTALALTRIDHAMALACALEGDARRRRLRKARA